MAFDALIGADIHDGTSLHKGMALLSDGDVCVGIVDPDDLPKGCEVRHLDGGVLAPGFVDLQVNGGGGVMFNDDQSVEALEIIARAHASVGTRAFLPTLITDTPGRNRAAIDAVADAIKRGISGVIGIHLEGPHLSISRKGAHDPSLIRPMTDDDLSMIAEAAKRLPNVILTVAPENVTRDQVALLCKSGVIISLGHTDATYDTCLYYAASGAKCTTHLFNAMSPLGSREPGLVGATLDNGAVSAGLIADGIHVHPATIRAALRAKQGPGKIFLVSDAMSTVGSEISEFELNGRTIYRRDGRLTLADGTLAGADLDLPKAIRVLVNQVGILPETAIAMASSIPASVLNTSGGFGRLVGGRVVDLTYLQSDFTFTELS